MLRSPRMMHVPEWREKVSGAGMACQPLACTISSCAEREDKGGRREGGVERHASWVGKQGWDTTDVCMGSQTGKSIPRDTVNTHARTLCARESPNEISTGGSIA